MLPDAASSSTPCHTGSPFFLISWRNPSAQQADWSFDTYAAAADRAIDVVRDVAGTDDVNVLGLCAGGILTAALLGRLAAHGDTRVHSASFGETLLDFGVPAPVGVFHARPLLALGRSRSARDGVLDAKTLSTVFTLLRPDDLIFNYVVNNDLIRERPPRFDILAWSADGTNLPAQLHRELLEIYQHNRLVELGAFEVLGTRVDLGRVEVETYVTGATTDHVTPWKGCYRTTQLLSGTHSTFVLSHAGHIASSVNPPGNPKAYYFAGPDPDSDGPDAWCHAPSAAKAPGGRTGPTGSRSVQAMSARPRRGSAAGGSSRSAQLRGPTYTARKTGAKATGLTASAYASAANSSWSSATTYASKRAAFSSAAAADHSE